MDNPNLLMVSSLLLLFFSSSATSMLTYPAMSEPDPLRTYIIQLSPPDNATFQSHDDLERWYRSYLPTEPSADSRMVFAYREAILGFAAKLTAREVDDMSRKTGFLKAHPDRVLSLFTTRTPAFLRLQQDNFWNGSSYGKGVIIGMLDTGIDPDHPSFSGDGMPPPPAKWKGRCTFNKTQCNNKLIGALAVDSSGHTPPLDEEGHGTHTASTAAGNFVTGANVLGNGNGTAVGMAPRAHLAIYRVCGYFGCMVSDVLGGMDEAILDGVDVMSLSLGADIHSYHDDVIAIGAFAAASKGIFVSCAAGNSGPISGSLSNEAPWILTVGASTMDRSIRVTVKLGNGQEIDGESLFQPADFKPDMLPLVYPGACLPESLNGTARGKIVVCQWTEGTPRISVGSTVKEAGGAGMILVNDKTDGYTTLAEAHVLPASHVSYDAGNKLRSYCNLTKNPTASLVFKGTVIGNTSAPTVASFSSRGPSLASPLVMKPDVIGPGVSVLAGWPSQVATSGSEIKNRPAFNIISGTSMSTPHLSGIAALVKSIHPQWSPAAIKSAIMTTSDTSCHDGKPVLDEQHNPATYFTMGAGHVNPEKASDPGLVYNITTEEYVRFLCGLGYKDSDVKAVTRSKVKCASLKKIHESELNYPSVAVRLGTDAVTVSRTVTHVGETGEKYTAEVDAPDGVEVSVAPNVLAFSKANEEKSFAVTLKRLNQATSGGALQGQLRWVSGKHVVRSPIVVMKWPRGRGGVNSGCSV